MGTLNTTCPLCGASGRPCRVHAPRLRQKRTPAYGWGWLAPFLLGAALGTALLGIMVGGSPVVWVVIIIILTLASAGVDAAREARMRGRR